MLFRRCCYCLPLRTGCIIIGIVFICLFLTEMIIHGQSAIFIYYKPRPWDYVQGIILSWGIVASMLLIYGSYKL
ncbi:GH22673 [Drosophila grimshawi]|uniref:GH22673 n=1 Tax=Drosophila grimshawi TaxID=7222 RepID=B4JVH7_DROGR|nr:GH22673 [Drosophila grimshawi]